MATSKDRRAELLRTIEDFVREVKRNSAAWSRECPGDVCANDSHGVGYSMETALMVAFTGDAPRDADSTLAVSEQTWRRLAKLGQRYPDPDGACDVESVALIVLEAAEAYAVREGAAGLRRYFTAGKSRVAKPRPPRMILSITEGSYCAMNTIGRVLNEEGGTAGIEWWAEPVARVFLGDEAFAEEAFRRLMRDAAAARSASSPSTAVVQ